MSQKKKETPRQIAYNKKARHYYELLNFFEAGIVLNGAEMKSIRNGGVNFNDAYVSFSNGEAFIVGLHIAPYANAAHPRPDPDRTRKLLLNAREIHSLTQDVDQKGLTVVPVDMHFTHGRAKLEIALARGKKLHDQRHDLKMAAERRDADRELARFK